MIADDDFEAVTKLGKEAIASSKWEWLPGMLGRDGPVMQRICDGDLPDDIARFVPDLFDDGTMGCLIGRVRKISGDPYVYVYPRFRQDGTAHEWTTVFLSERFSGKSEQEVLLWMLRRLE